MKDDVSAGTILVVVVVVVLIIGILAWRTPWSTNKPAPSDIPYAVKHMDPLVAAARQTYALERIAASLERMEDRQAEKDELVGTPPGGR